MAMGLYGTPYGMGVVHNVTANSMHKGFGGFSLITDTARIELAGSGGLKINKFTIPAETVRSLKYGFTTLNELTLAEVYGGSNTASTGQSYIEGSESYLIAVGSAYTMTLAHTPSEAGAVVVVSIDAYGNIDATWTQGLAASAGVYTISGTSLVFAAADAGKTVYAYYTYTNATGVKTTIEMDDAPAVANLKIGVLRAARGVTNASLQQIWHFGSVIPEAPKELSWPRGASNLIEIEASITSDIIVYTN
jgi:hypothetical protein